MSSSADDATTAAAGRNPARAPHVPGAPAIGAHVDPADPIGAARALGLDAVQIFLGDPQSWKAPYVVSPGGAAALREAAREAGVLIYVHAPYLINVASPNNRIRIPSRKLLNATVALAAEVGASGVIVHGGHVTGDTDDAVGFDNWRKAFEGLDRACPVLIENTAGGNHAMARHPEVNSSLDLDRQEIVVRPDVNLGIAAATRAALGWPHGPFVRVDRGIEAGDARETLRLSLS